MVSNTSGSQDGTIDTVSLVAEGLQCGEGGTSTVKGSAHGGLTTVGSSKELFRQDDLWKERFAYGA
jgi:hypothetical protein